MIARRLAASPWAAILLAAATVFLSASPAAADLTEADVVARCAAERPVAPGSAYTVRHTGYTDLDFRVQNPFPGPGPEDVMIEVVVTANATFACEPITPDGAAVAGAGFEVVMDEHPGLFRADMQICELRDGARVMTDFFPGAPCPFAMNAGFPGGTSTIPGPFAVVIEAAEPDCTVFRPEALGEGGLRHPIIVWGNGTTGTPYSPGISLSQFASHGFVVVAANTGFSGSGREMTECLDAFLAGAEDPSSSYHRVVNPYRIGVMGFSQGGGGALMSGQDSRVTTSILLHPYIGPSFGTELEAAQRQNGALFIVSGENDTIAPMAEHQRPIFETTNAEAYWVTIAGAGHYPFIYQTPIALAWARWRLMHTPEMEAVFVGPACTLCLDPRLSIEQKPPG